MLRPHLTATVDKKQDTTMEIVGYSDRFSVRPGQTIRFMVSSTTSTYRAEIVRLRHTDANPQGPGFKTEALRTSVDGSYPGRRQSIHSGSYVQVPHDPVFNCLDGFSLEAWIYPTTPDQGPQGILTRFCGKTGYGLFIDADGALALWVGDGERVEKISSDGKLKAAKWYFVAASYDSATGAISISAREQTCWPGIDIKVRKTIDAIDLTDINSDFLIAACRDWSAADRLVTHHFNGKVDNPRLYQRAFSSPDEYSTEFLVADWDFAQNIDSDIVSDTSINRLDGRIINLPTRAVTGHNWTGDESDYKVVPDQYGAIHFHDDDLENANWELGFEWSPPDDIPSGVYAAHLQTADDEDYLPFIVVPRTARARIAFLAPTLSYLIYANQRFIDPIRAALNLGANDDTTPQNLYMHEQRLLSTYDLHSDGSGTCYSSRLRPILNFRPLYRMPSRSLAANWPRLLNADLHLLDWLDEKGFAYDVITDDELHHEGSALLEPYQVVLTGTHPEYWTTQMLAGLESYQAGGGRLMYLGGNGFYWIASFDPLRPHIAEVRRWRGSRAWEAAPGECYHSTTGEMGGLWRFRNRAPQKMVGVGFTAQGGGRNRPYQRHPESFDPRAAFIFEGIDAEELIGDFPALVLEHGAGGFEIDRADCALGTPEHALVLASATDFTDRYQVAIEDQLVSTPNTGGSQTPLVRSDMVYFEGPKGGAVFSVGSISWCSCLSYNGADNTVSRITENVLRHFSADNPERT